MPGKEPMNPRAGQFALGGTLSGWVELDRPSPRQAKLLKRCYSGREPRTLSRYGVHQWTAVLPWGSTVVKDPFALLSVPAIVACTGAVPVVVYRHAGAVLSSFRRMGWTANTVEIRQLQGIDIEPAPPDDVTAMVEMWTFLHRRVLRWLPSVPDAVLVSHSEVATRGAAGVDQVRMACGLPALRRPPGRSSAGPVPAASDDRRLHNFNRQSDEVANGWRERLAAGEVEALENGTADVLAELDARRLRLR